MTDIKKAENDKSGAKPKKLELNKTTLADLTPRKGSETVRGGARNEVSNICGDARNEVSVNGCSEAAGECA